MGIRDDIPYYFRILHKVIFPNSSNLPEITKDEKKCVRAIFSHKHHKEQQKNNYVPSEYGFHRPE
jgi:hypothetical protein